MMVGLCIGNFWSRHRAAPRLAFRYALVATTAGMSANREAGRRFPASEGSFFSGEKLAAEISYGHLNSGRNFPVRRVAENPAVSHLTWIG